MLKRRIPIFALMGVIASAAAVVAFVVVFITTRENATPPVTGADNLRPSSARDFVEREKERSEKEAARQAALPSDVQAQPATQSAANSVLAQTPTRINGADLFIHLEQYVGKQVIVTDCGVFMSGNYGAGLNCDSGEFKLDTDGIDRESFRFFLTECGSLGEPRCKMPLLVTPTGQKLMNMPVLKDVKIAR
jgi:hypothetical protein